MLQTPATYDLRRFTVLAESVRTPAALRHYAEKLRADGADDYTSLIDAAEKEAATSGIFLNEGDTAKLVGVSCSTLYRRRLKGIFPRSERISEARVAYNRFTVMAYVIGVMSITAPPVAGS